MDCCSAVGGIALGVCISDSAAAAAAATAEAPSVLVRFDAGDGIRCCGSGVIMSRDKCTATADEALACFGFVDKSRTPSSSLVRDAFEFGDAGLEPGAGETAATVGAIVDAAMVGNCGELLRFVVIVDVVVAMHRR